MVDILVCNSQFRLMFKGNFLVGVAFFFVLSDGKLNSLQMHIKCLLKKVISEIDSGKAQLSEHKLTEE